VRETVQGVKRVSPRRTNVDCYPAFGCMPRRLKMMRWSFDDHSGVGIGLAAPKSASSATSRTLRPIDSVVGYTVWGLASLRCGWRRVLTSGPMSQSTIDRDLSPYGGAHRGNSRSLLFAAQSRE